MTTFVQFLSRSGQLPQTHHLLKLLRFLILRLDLNLKVSLDIWSTLSLNLGVKLGLYPI